MTRNKRASVAAALIALFTLSSTATTAQEETPTVIPPPTFTDGRINGEVGLGGLAIYCVGENGDTNVDTFENGTITVWGIGDQKYVELVDYQLRGRIEIPQQPSVMEVQMDQTATAQPAQPTEQPTATTATTATMTATEEATETATPEGEEAVLLARATTPTGEIGFFRVGEDEFALQGHDDKGAFFTYTWMGCNAGTLDNTTAPYLPMLEASATLEFIEATPEVTASS